MESNRNQDVAKLESMSVAELREQYAHVFGEVTASHNRVWLLRRIAWRMQALAQGDLSERAQRRAAELANDADLRLSGPRTRESGPLPMSTTDSDTCLNGHERHLVPGTVVRRPYKGTVLEVKVLTHGFEYQGAVYRSLSAVAKAITGSHCSGYGFFNLRGKEAS